MLSWACSVTLKLKKSSRNLEGAQLCARFVTGKLQVKALAALLARGTFVNDAKSACLRSVRLGESQPKLKFKSEGPWVHLHSFMLNWSAFEL